MNARLILVAVCHLDRFPARLPKFLGSSHGLHGVSAALGFVVQRNQLIRLYVRKDALGDGCRVLLGRHKFLLVAVLSRPPVQIFLLW